MASSAGLMAGALDHTFDSSIPNHSNQHNNPDDTAAGITFGSVADSFHSEDYDNEQAAQPWQSAEPRSSQPGRAQDDFDSLLDETEMSEQDSPPETRYDPPPRHSTNQPGGSRPTSRATGATSSRGSLRNPVQAAQGSMGPPLTRRTLKSAVLDLGGDRSLAGESSVSPADASGQFRRLNRDDQSEASYATGINGKGKGREDKSVEKVGQNMTLREQEKVIDMVKKENFDLKLKIHFYTQRLERTQPEHIQAALNENVQLKVEWQTLRDELKRYKKLLRESTKTLEQVVRERDSLHRGMSAGPNASKREREMEKRMIEQERELDRLRADADKRRGEEWGGEDARAEISRLRSELDSERDSREDALAERDDLAHQLRQAQDLLDETEDALATAREESQGPATFERKLADLEEDNNSLRSQLAAQLTMLATRNAEKTALAEDVDELRAEIERMGGELDQHVKARSDRSLDGLDGRGKEQLLLENDEYRDRASAQALIVEGLETHLEEKEREIEGLLQDLEDRDADHAEQAKQYEDELQELQDLPAAIREAEEDIEELRTALQDAQAELGEKDEQADKLGDEVERLMRELAAKERQAAEDGDEIEALTEDLKKLGGQIFALEEEAELREEEFRQLADELAAADEELKNKQSVHDQVVDALKQASCSHACTLMRSEADSLPDYPLQKVEVAKADLNDAQIERESAEAEARHHRDKVDGLTARISELQNASRQDLETRRRLEDDVETIMRALRKEEEERDLEQAEFNRQRREDDAKWNRQLETKDRDTRRAESESKQIKEVLVAREKDIQDLQNALDGVERSLSRQDETATNDRFALELELDRLKRDLIRLDNELNRTRQDADARAETVRERDMTLATLNSEIKDLNVQLATQTQARLGLTDKFDQGARALRETQDELQAARDRLRVVEEQLSTDHRSLSRTEAQYRDQLTERNTLLLTAYQYLEKMVGPDRNSPRKPGHNDPKPFANFPIFHDSLLTRLKAVNGLQTSFDRRAKEIESKFGDQFVLLKRQTDSRLRQLDKFEQQVKQATETQRQWRHRVNVKTTELDEIRAENTQLQQQLTQVRRGSSASGGGPGSPVDSMKLANLTTRATTAERRLAATQGQLNLAEEKLEDARRKVAVAEGKWEARLLELQTRLRAAEEQTKRERQGAKERVGELAETIKNLEGQVQGARRRDYQLGEVLTETERNKQNASARGSPAL